MLIRLGFEITYRFPEPAPVVLTLSLHDSRRADVLVARELRTTPEVPLRQYHDGFGNVCTRLVSPAGALTVFSDAVVADTGWTDEIVPAAQQVPVYQLPDETLLYLLGSRYCETDKLMDKAWALFGHTPTGWARVQAICDYVHDNIQFGYEYADATRGAWGALEEGHGVCRDFAHSAVALCRCMNIPARYCTGFLGNIGVPPTDAPGDFSAWFEAFLDGKWYTFDARHNVPRIGRVLIARGRDATDVAISNIFGTNTLESFVVWADETTDPTLSPRE